MSRPAPVRRSLAARALHTFLHLFAVAALVLIAPLAAHADDVTLSIDAGPVPKGSGRGEQLAWALEPGATVEDSVVITNFDDSSLQLDVVAKDGVTTSSGLLDLAPAETADTGIGSWVHLEKDHVDIPAGGTATVPFTLKVPKDAAPGDYSGGIAAILGTEGSAVSVQNRVATRLDVRVAGDVTVAHTVSDLHVDMPSTWHPLSPSTATVHYTLTNTGNARIYVQESVTAAGPLGIGALRTDATLDEILPGASVDRTATVDARALVWNRVTVDTTAFGVDETPGTSAQLHADTFAAPWTQLIVALVLVALAIVLGLKLGSRRR